MASSFGKDAGRSAIEASYTRVVPALSSSFLQRVEKEAISHLQTFRMWQRAGIVLLHPTEEGGFDMSDVASRALAAGKRVGLAVITRACVGSGEAEAGAAEAGAAEAGEAEAGEAEVGAAEAGAAGQTSVSTVDFIEITDPTEVNTFDVAQLPISTGKRSEGDTISFSCFDLIGSICLVPGLVFDGEGFRVGSDEGAYDRFLRLYPGHKIALIHSLQVSSNPLPRAAGAVPVDYVVSDSAVWHCNH